MGDGHVPCFEFAESFDEAEKVADIGSETRDCGGRDGDERFHGGGDVVVKIEGVIFSVCVCADVNLGGVGGAENVSDFGEVAGVAHFFIKIVGRTKRDDAEGGCGGIT